MAVCTMHHACMLASALQAVLCGRQGVEDGLLVGAAQPSPAQRPWERGPLLPPPHMYAQPAGRRPAACTNAWHALSGSAACRMTKVVGCPYSHPIPAPPCPALICVCARVAAQAAYAARCAATSSQRSTSCGAARAKSTTSSLRPPALPTQRPSSHPSTPVGERGPSPPPPPPLQASAAAERGALCNR